MSGLAPPSTSAFARMAEIEARFNPPAVDTQEGTAISGAALSAALSGSDQFDAILAALTGQGSGGSGDAVSTRGTGSVTGDDVVAGSMQYLGIPYKWGGTDPNVGLDCSALVQRVYKDLGIDLPRVSRDQARVGTEVGSIAEARPGDLIAFGSPVDHIGIYAGNGNMIQAPRSGDVVKIGPIKRTDIATIRRIIPDAPIDLRSSSGTGRATGASLPANVPYRDAFVSAANKYGLDPRLLAAVGKVESNFNASATSRAGARGLMQFMPSTAAGMGIDPMDPNQAIDGAARYLSTQLARFGSVDLALAAYNAGPGAVQRAGGVPPYAETQNYVRKVVATMSGFGS